MGAAADKPTDLARAEEWTRAVDVSTGTAPCLLRTEKGGAGNCNVGAERRGKGAVGG